LSCSGLSLLCEVTVYFLLSCAVSLSLAIAVLGALELSLRIWERFKRKAYPY
jgi:hypothetical protein